MKKQPEQFSKQYYFSTLSNIYQDKIAVFLIIF